MYSELRLTSTEKYQMLGFRFDGFYCEYLGKFAFSNTCVLVSWVVLAGFYWRDRAFGTWFWDVVCRKSVPCDCWWIQSSALPANKFLMHNRGEFEIVCYVYFVLEIPLASEFWVKSMLLWLCWVVEVLCDSNLSTYELIGALILWLAYPLTDSDMSCSFSLSWKCSLLATNSSIYGYITHLMASPLVNSI